MTIKMQYIPDLVAAAAAAVNSAVQASHGFPVYYDWGNIFDIKRQLQDKDGDPALPGKYPLIWLVTPFDERSGDRLDMYATVNLRFIIAHNTEQNYYMHERRDLVFLPILYPVLAELIKQFRRSRSFTVIDPLSYTKRDLQLARVDQEGKHLLNDAADVIDVTFSNLLVKNIC